ncbi:MAG: hypothetical protein M1812_004213 [Candelaria pacifica]|nr:MAG: hypothetical protein M1812_004213 [Candelaria pacifica]
MPFSLKSFLSLAGPIFLAILMAVAGVSLSKINALSLPISPYLAAATVLLPAVNGVGLYGARSLVPSNSRHRTKSSSHLSGPVLVVGVLLVIYETVIVTLALTHMVPPSGLTCGLNETWMSLFQHKNSDAINRIQNTFKCCGLHSTRDKAWPFPDKNHGADACVKTLGWQKSCFGDWRQGEQISAGLLLMVALLVFVSKVLFSLSLFTNQRTRLILGVLFLLRTRSPWAHRILHTPWMQNKQYTAITSNGEPHSEHGESYDDGTVRRHRQIEAAYSDEPITEESEQANSSRTTPSAERGQEEVGTRVQPSGLHGGQNEWSEERGER